MSGVARDDVILASGFQTSWFRADGLIAEPKGYLLRRQLAGAPQPAWLRLWLSGTRVSVGPRDRPQGVL